MLVSEYQFEVLWSTQQRKHKTWKDGKLKYNAFNKKVLLFDENSNVIVSGWAAKPPEEGADLEIENAHVQIGSLLSRKESEHHARKVPVFIKESPKRQLPGSSISLDEIITRSKMKRPTPIVPVPIETSVQSSPREESFVALNDTPDTSMDNFSDEEIEILAVSTVEPPKGGPIDFPDKMPDSGPWTKEAYLLTSWRPPLIKEEPI